MTPEVKLMFVIVLFDPSIVLFVNVSVFDAVTTVGDDGNPDE